MSLKGNLSSVNLTEIFQMLSLSGREGTLFIYEGGRKRAICFTKDGVSIRSRERNEGNLIGKILVRLGKITDEDLERAIEQRRATSKLLGDVLVEAEACMREDVDLAFRVQSQEDIQDLFLNRSEAQFEYVDGYFPETDHTPYVSLSVNSLLIEIARRTDEWEYIRRRIRGPREIYRFSGQEAEIEAEILQDCYSHRIDPLIDGNRSVGDIIDQSYVDKFEVCKLLATYLDKEVIELVPPDAIRQSARTALRTGDTGNAIHHYEYLLSTGDFPLEVMGEAAEAHEANRDYGEAAALLRRLAEEMVRSGDPRGAMDTLRRVANYPKPEPEALRFLLDLAFQHPRVAAEFQPSVVEAGKTLVAAHVQSDQREEALALLGRLVKAFPDEVNFALSLVNLHYEDGDVDRAVQECERLAAGFLKRKRSTPAVSLYKKLLIMDPDRQDIREKLRKIRAGKRKSPRSGALPRIAVTLAVAGLVGSLAFVLLKPTTPVVTHAAGIDPGTLKELSARLSMEQGVADDHGKTVVAGYRQLVSDLGSDPVSKRDALIARAKSVEQRRQTFVASVGKARSLAQTILAKGRDDDHARAQAAEDRLRELEGSVDDAATLWQREAQRAAERLYERGVAQYQAGQFRPALAGLELALALETKADWSQLSQLRRYVDNIRGDIARVERELAQARKREKQELWPAARGIYLRLVKDFPDSDLVAGVRLPVSILTIPPGAAVSIDGKLCADATPAIVRVHPKGTTKIVLKRPGFKDKEVDLEASTDANQFEFTYTLSKKATWRYELDGSPVIESAPAVWNGKIAVAARDGSWVVLDSMTGRCLKHGTINSLDGVSAGLVCDGKRLYMAALNKKLYAFDANTLELDPSCLQFEDKLRATPVLDDGILYVVDLRGNVAACDTNAWPAKKWTKKTTYGVRVAPVVCGEHLVVVTTIGTVTVLDKRTGKVEKEYSLQGPFDAPPAVAGAESLVFGSRDGTLTRVDVASGTIVWKQPLERPIHDTPSIRGQVVFVGAEPGRMAVVNLQTGDPMAVDAGRSLAAKRASSVLPCLFFISGSSLAAFAPLADQYGLAWSFAARNPVLAAPTLSKSAIFLCDKHGSVYRVEIR